MRILTWPVSFTVKNFSPAKIWFLFSVWVKRAALPGAQIITPMLMRDFVCLRRGRALRVLAGVKLVQ